MKLAIVGITGLVGQEICRVIEEFDVAFDELLPVASEKSIGKTVTLKGREYPVIGLEEAVILKPELALFSAGGGSSRGWARRIAEVGSFVVDNSSAWRMDPQKKLIVPELNADVLTPYDRLIANHNCSTIQMVLAISQLRNRSKVK